MQSKQEHTNSRVLGGVGICLNMDEVSFSFEDNVVILLNLSALLTLANPGVSIKGIGKGVPPLGKGLRDFGARPKGDIEDPNGCVGEVLDGVYAVALARDDFDGGAAAVDIDGGDLGGAKVAVAWLAGLEMLGKVDPELETDIWATVGGFDGHLSVDDATAGGHELEVAFVEGATLAGEVFVLGATAEDVCDCFLATMRAVVLVFRR